MNAHVRKDFTGKHFQGKLLTCLDSKGMSKRVFELQGAAYIQNLALLESHGLILRFFRLSWVRHILIYPGVAMD